MENSNHINNNAKESEDHLSSNHINDITSSEVVSNNETTTEKEPGFSDLPLEDKIRYYSLPFFGFFMLFFIWFELYKPQVFDNWIKGTILLENSAMVQDPTTRNSLLEKGKAILNQELQKHPYHARVWHLYGQYYILTNQLDSCIFYEKKAIDIGAGGIVNQVEPLAADKINYCLSIKLNLIHNSLDSSLIAIKQAETPKFDNFMIDKFKGLVFSKYDQLDSSNLYLKHYLLTIPDDVDVIYKLAENYFKQKNKKEALFYAGELKSLNKKNIKIDTLLKKIYAL